MLKGLQEIEGVITYGNIPLKERIGVVSFNIKNQYHADVSLDIGWELLSIFPNPTRR